MPDDLAFLGCLGVGVVTYTNVAFEHVANRTHFFRKKKFLRRQKLISLPKKTSCHWPYIQSFLSLDFPPNIPVQFSEALSVL